MADEIEGIEAPVPECQKPEDDHSTAFVGFDSAWADNPKSPGAICAVSREGGKWIRFKPPEFASFEQASDFVQSLKNEYALIIVAIDQPTIVPNLTGGRPVDRVAGRLIGWLGGGVVLANRSIKGMFDDDAPIWRFLTGIGCIQNPETARSASSGLFVTEVFPALALVSRDDAFFGRLEIPRYNPKLKTFQIEHWRRVVDTAKNWATGLALSKLADWYNPMRAIEKPRKGDQDRLDSTICMLVAITWLLAARQLSAMLGDLTNGYMITPVNAAVRARLADAAVKVRVPIDGEIPGRRIGADSTIRLAGELMTNTKKMSPTRALAAKVIYAGLSILRDNGKELPVRDLMEKVQKTVSLDAWAKERYEKTGYVRWESIFHFYSIDCVKAGWVIKKKGIWYLTHEGEDALKLGADKLLDTASQLYRKWRADNPITPKQEEEEDGEEVAVEEQSAKVPSYDDIEQRAIQGLQQYINAKNPYEFQDLVAALLRGMGYYTPFIAPKGKDGGVDVIAYRDPLGTQSPRIQVQIKHKEATASVQEVRQLMGLLQKEGDVGMFVSTSGFSPDARSAARGSHVHVELVDLNRFITLWQEFYEKLKDEDKNLLPLRPIYFLAPID
jgi:restriction system protein